MNQQDLLQIKKIIDESLEEKLESKLEEKLESKLEEKLDRKLEEKLESKLEQKLTEKFANYPTKQDLKFALDDLLAHIVDATDGSKADKQDVQKLEQRVDTLEKEVFHN